ncbi:UDP-N-acetylmuramoyl-L-alanine--D-glutamate ligase [bacterium]|nr:UDP-N-acetylmuramoyl-L-alanine--D-glutamate ligase [bacterium]
MSERILILGAARSGQWMARLLREQGVCATLSDLKLTGADLPEDLRDLPFLAGDFRETWLDDFDALLISPGVAQDSPPVLAARARGLRVTGEMEESFRLSQTPVAAITGTNGKSTTTTLLSLILEASGLEAPAGGNLGRPASQIVLEQPKADVHVLEVSSFQAETFHQFHPKVATLLNLTPDHLDRYTDFESYVEAKLRCFAAMSAEDTLVLPQDPNLERRLEKLPTRRLAFGCAEESGDGAFYSEGRILVRYEGRVQDVMPLEELGVLGRHNLANALAALAMALPLGLNAEGAAQALREFKGLPHRMEYAGKLGPLACYNDSKATNVEAALASLSGLEASILLIAGGRDKGGDFGILARELPGLRRVYAIGEAAPAILEAFGDRAVEAKDLSGALAAAAKEGRDGEMLILSPACSSFDQFRDFEARGEAFMNLVKEGL